MIVLKIFLFILLGILAIVLLLLMLPITADLSFMGGNLKYRVKYAFAVVLDSEKKSSDAPKNDKAKKKKKPESDGSQNKKPTEIKLEKAEGKTPDENNSEAKPEKKRKKTLGEKIEFVLKLLELANRPVRHLLKGIHISDLYIDFLVANEDACKCAVRYGKVSGIVYNLIAILEEFFTVSYKTVDIECGYNQEESRWDISCRLRIIPMTAVISAVWLLIKYFFKIYLPQNNKTKKSKKTAGAQPLES